MRIRGRFLLFAVVVSVPLAAVGLIALLRIDGTAINALFQDIQLQNGAVLGVFDSQGRILYRKQTGIAVGHEISGREEKLKELDRLKSEFVSSVSHELRTPLTTIKTLTRLLQRDDLSRKEQQEHLGIIAAECDREIDLVLKLLDLSRIESGDYRAYPEILRPAEIIKACVLRQQAAAQSHGHKLRLDASEELPVIFADRAGVERALGGLIENAIKYTPRGGTISAGAIKAQSDIAFYVKDTGIGIRPEDIPRIFDRFYRGRMPDAGLLSESITPAGVGLGLYLVSNIIARMGGRVDVESVVGKGSTFKLYLPIAENLQAQSVVTEELNVEAVARGR